MEGTHKTNHDKQTKPQNMQLQMGKDFEHFPKDVQMVNKYVKKGLNIITYKEMQNKTRMRYHIIPLRMSTFRKTKDTKCRPAHGERGALYTPEGNVNQYNLCIKQYEDSSRNCK